MTLREAAAGQGAGVVKHRSRDACNPYELWSGPPGSYAEGHADGADSEAYWVLASGVMGLDDTIFAGVPYLTCRPSGGAGPHYSSVGATVGNIGFAIRSHRRGINPPRRAEVRR